MLGGGGNPSAWWDVAEGRTGHDVSGEASGVTGLAQGNDYIGIELGTDVSPAADAWWAPIDTISNSEAGFERVYQGSALLVSWPVSLEPGARCDVRIDQRVATARDHAEDEAERAAAAPA
jgi:hypothetical protein